MRIYFLRHGETDWNVAKRIQGRTDIALNALGVRQAESWRRFFDRIRLAGVYSSALSRAMDTALLASRRAPCLIDDLNERHYGEWEGRIWHEIAGKEPEFDRYWRRADSSPPGGESRFEMHDRVCRAMDDIVASHEPDAEILVVAHGGSGKAVLGYANKMSIEDLSTIPPLANASMTLLSRDRDGWGVAAAMTAADAVDAAAAAIRA